MSQTAGLNAVPSGERVHIGFFGMRNAGKSSLVNAFTGQQLAIVSDKKGTTTDPVYKAMELLPMGPVMIVDTPGFDDEGELGELRVKKTKQVLNKVDVAILVVDAAKGLSDCDRQLVEMFLKKEVPYLIVYNKSDIVQDIPTNDNTVSVSALKGIGMRELKERVSTMLKTEDTKLKIVGDIIEPSDFVVLVVPIDSAAPKGRLILPQQQTIRDILEAGATSIVCRESELSETLAGISKKPSLVITDSQAFEKVSADTPEDIKLTSFSILMARYKGFLETAVEGVHAIDKLKDGDKILISRWLKKYTGKELIIETSSGRDFPENLKDYALIIHCGGCMLNEREVRYRMKCAVDSKVPFTNYGITIAYMQGILKRSLEIFPKLLKDFK